jgi:hypothetical protein
MSLIKWILIIIVILFALAYFMPGTFSQLKNVTINKIKNLADKQETNETAVPYDYGKILGFKECKSDSECFQYFNIVGIQCSINGTCVVTDGQ